MMLTCALRLLLLPIGISIASNQDEKDPTSRSDANFSSRLLRRSQRPTRTKQGNVSFEPAMPLDFFKNVDPELFEWVNPNEIAPGVATCGFLNARLGALPDVNYPMVKVYVCVKFAAIQPAPKGNIAVHCGGPGSLSGCVYIMGGEENLGPENVDQYNVIGFDQRGMGRSEPTFVVDECNVINYDLNSARALINLNDEATVRAHAQIYKDRALGCWAYEGFKLKATSKDGEEKTYHFLEYSGTRQLVEDIERVRVIFGDQKLSVFGISYGTKVMGSYATVFPKNVNLLVLDGNDDPNVDIVENTVDLARSSNQRIDFFIASCDMFPDTCPVDNMRECINELNFILKENSDDIYYTFGIDNPSNLMFHLIKLIFADFAGTPTLCNFADQGDYDSIKALLLSGNSEYIKKNENWFSMKSGQFLPFDTESSPTSGSSNTWPFTDYQIKAELLTADIITAEDYAFGAYDEDQYVKFLMNLNQLYPGAGTQVPTIRAKQWYSACYFWPNASPMSPVGNPDLNGIVAGQLYDPYTPYIWTQRMRENFKLTSLLTSRSVNHGLMYSEEEQILDPHCMEHVHTYLETGIVPFTDGTVCESDSIGKSCTIDAVISGEHCVESSHFEFNTSVS